MLSRRKFTISLAKYTTFGNYSVEYREPRVSIYFFLFLFIFFFRFVLFFFDNFFLLFSLSNRSLTRSLTLWVGCACLVAVALRVYVSLLHSSHNPFKFLMFSFLTHNERVKRNKTRYISRHFLNYLLATCKHRFLVVLLPAACFACLSVSLCSFLSKSLSSSEQSKARRHLYHTYIRTYM